MIGSNWTGLAICGLPKLVIVRLGGFSSVPDKQAVSNTMPAAVTNATQSIVHI